MIAGYNFWATEIKKKGSVPRTGKTFGCSQTSFDSQYNYGLTNNLHMLARQGETLYSNTTELHTHVAQIKSVKLLCKYPCATENKTVQQ